MKIRTLAGLLVVIAAGIFCVGYTPTNLGGQTTYMSTYGTSMLPRFHAGDLAIVQPAKKYHVGDVVAYRSSTLHGATVLHRIVAINGGHFTFKGDNNKFLDPARPTADQIVGRLRFRVPYGGAVRSLLTRPLLLFPLLAIVIGGAGSGLLVRKKRRRRSSYDQQRTPSNAQRGRPRRRLGVVVPIAATLGAVGFLVAAVTVWNIPRSETTTRREAFVQHLAVRYTAVTPKGAAYPDGIVDTGDPIFTRLVNRVDVGLDYNLHADKTPRRITGTYQVLVNVESATGWSRSIPLTPPRSFSGDHFHARAPLRLDALRSLEARFSAETGLVTTQATISIAPRVHVHGDIANTPFSDDVSSKLDFRLSPIEMIPTSTADLASAARTASTGSVMVATVRRGELVLWKLHISLEAARIALLIAFALGLAAAAAVLVVDRRLVTLGELDAIHRRYGRLLIAVDSIPPVGERTMVRVESMRALARLAHAHEQPVVHADGPHGHRFALSTDAVVYYYDTAGIRPRRVVVRPVPA